MNVFQPCPRRFGGRLVVAALVLAAPCVLGGCRTSSSLGGGRGVPDDFPTARELAAVATRPAPVIRADVHVDAASWVLAGPFPDRFGDAPLRAAAAGGSLVDDLVLEAVGPAHTSENAACAAREVGRVFLQTGKYPDARLERFLVGRCGLGVESVASRSFTWDDVAETTTDAALVSRSRDELRSALVDLGQPDHVVVGAVLLRDPERKRALLFAAAAHRKVRVAAGPQVIDPAAGKVVVDGTLVDDRSETVYAHVAQGLLGAVECTRDEAVALPAFRFTCPLLADDSSARVDVTAREKGRVLGAGVASILVVQKPEGAAEYKEVVYETALEPAVDAASAASAAPGALSAQILAGLNRVRATAGAPALSNLTAQSDTTTRVAAHWFANAFAERPDGGMSDLIALGLMAGWDVKDIVIHDAGFATLLDESGGIDDLIGSALDRPSLRSLLLSKTATAAAIGPTQVSPDVTGVVVVTYEPLVTLDHQTAAKDVFEKLKRTRAERGVGALGEIPTEEIMLAAARRIQSGEDVDAVAHEALRASVTKMSRNLTLWTLEVYDVEHMVFPDELLRARPTYIAVAVATHKRPRSAWGSTVVLVLGFVDRVQVAMATP